ncbi:MAG: hypothetical protein JSS99_01310 [Actinobacteria bacterium]|nr:hypothetical protein [Actinomycetota bacterium]
MTMLLALVAVLGASVSAGATWTAGPPLLNPTSGAGAALLGDGTVLVAGGNSARPGLAVNERFDPAAGTWSAVAAMNYQRSGLVLVPLHDGSALAVGGDDNGTFPIAERYDPNAGAWTSTEPPSGGGRGDYPAVVVLLDGRVVSIGGGHYDIANNDTSIYDPATNQWTTPADYPYFVRGNAATVLADGRVLSAGGSASLGDLGDKQLDDVFVFDVATSTWTPVARLPAPRSGARAVTLHDGRVLLAGGAPDASGLLYDVGSDRWTPTGALPAGATPSTLVLLPDGRVLGIGGTDPGTGTTSAALFDPATSGWTNAGPLLAQRGPTRSFTATLLPDGRVLVAGGELPDRTILSSTEIWSPGGTPPPPRCTPHHGRGHGKAKGRHKHRHECKGGHRRHKHHHGCKGGHRHAHG